MRGWGKTSGIERDREGRGLLIPNGLIFIFVYTIF